MGDVNCMCIVCSWPIRGAKYCNACLAYSGYILGYVQHWCADPWENMDVSANLSYYWLFVLVHICQWIVVHDLGNLRSCPKSDFCFYWSPHCLAEINQLHARQRKGIARWPPDVIIPKWDFPRWGYIIILWLRAANWQRNWRPIGETWLLIIIIINNAYCWLSCCLLATDVLCDSVYLFWFSKSYRACKGFKRVMRNEV